MTTVINFNFLNVVRLRQNNITVNNDVHPFTQYPQCRTQKLDAGEGSSDDVIDITPGNQALIDPRHARQGGMAREYFFAKPLRIEIYNRYGKTMQFSDAKGLLIDAYI